MLDSSLRRNDRNKILWIASFLASGGCKMQRMNHSLQIFYAFESLYFHALWDFSLVCSRYHCMSESELRRFHEATVEHVDGFQ